MLTQKPSYRFEIDNVSKTRVGIDSQIFVSGGCEWYLKVYKEGLTPDEDYMSLNLHVAYPNSLNTGWKRMASYYFVVLKEDKNLDKNQDNQEIYRSSTFEALFDAKAKSSGETRVDQVKGLLENYRLIVEVYINVVEADDGEGGDVSEKTEPVVDSNGFQAFASHFNSVRKTFTEHVTKKEYMNVLSNACNKVSELAEEGLKMDWLKSKIDELSLKMKKSDYVDRSQIQQVEERITNLEMMAPESRLESLESKRRLEEYLHTLQMAWGVRLDSLKSKLEVESMERKKADVADRSRFHKLEESVKTLEMIESEERLEILESQLEEASLERKKADVADRSRFHKLEESLMNLEMIESEERLESLESKLEEASLERKKENNAYGSRFQKLEKSLKSLEMIKSSLESKLEEASSERKKENDAYGSRFQNLEESLKNLEMIKSSLESKLEEASLERMKENDAYGSRFQNLEESLKSLEMMNWEVRLDRLETNLEEVSLEKKKAHDAYVSRFQKLEESLKSLELMKSKVMRLDRLESKLEEVSLERKKADEADGSRFKKLDESLKSLEKMVSDVTTQLSNLKVEMDEDKFKSTYDSQYFFVDEALLDD